MGRRLQNLSNRQVLGVLVALVIVSAVGSGYIHLTGDEPDFTAWGEGWLQHFSAEMLGAIATFLLFELIVSRGDEQERLILRLSSKENDTALDAVEALRRRGWLLDGSLQGANLRFARLEKAWLRDANLQGVDLRDAALERADLWQANLQGATLERANLQGAVLSYANLAGATLWHAVLQAAHLRGVTLHNADLRGAYLERTDLREVDFRRANLERANVQGAVMRRADLRDAALEGVNLQGVDLRNADLQGAILEDANLCGVNLARANLAGAVLQREVLGIDLDARFDEHTILPDGTRWTPDVDMARFTDPAHPDFWRADKPHSPAYEE